MTRRMLKETIVQHVVALMVAISPPNRPHFQPEAQETEAIARARYGQIATTMVNVAYDPLVQPLFRGKRGRLRTLGMMFSISYFESGWRRDVDIGLGRERLGRQGWNDYGRSWCMMQVHLGKRAIPGPDGQPIITSVDNTAEGWSGPELLSDRYKCFKAGVEVLRKSLSTCASLPFNERLSAYASGTCSKGAQASRSRMRRAQQTVEALMGKGVPEDSEVDQN